MNIVCHQKHQTNQVLVTILEKGTVKSLSSTHHLVAGEFVKASCMGYQVLNYCTSKFQHLQYTVVRLVTKLKNGWLGIACVAKCVATEVNKNFNIKKGATGLCQSTALKTIQPLGLLAHPLSQLLFQWQGACICNYLNYYIFSRPILDFPLSLLVFFMVKLQNVKYLFLEQCDTKSCLCCSPVNYTQRILHGRAEIRNFSLSVEHEKEITTALVQTWTFLRAFLCYLDVILLQSVTKTVELPFSHLFLLIRFFNITNK